MLLSNNNCTSHTRTIIVQFFHENAQIFLAKYFRGPLLDKTFDKSDLIDIWIIINQP